MISASDISRASRLYFGLSSLAGHSVRPFLDLGPLADRLALYTVLRNGTDRYISEYHHDSVKRGFADGLEEWLRYESRWNFQTKALAGTEDLEKAKSVIENRMAVVGILEEYDAFVKDVQSLFFPVRFDPEYVHRNKAGLPRGSVDGKPVRLEPVPEAMRRKCAERNELDNKLYDHVKSVVLPEQRARISRTTGSREYKEYVDSCRIGHRTIRRRAYTAYRNLVYKPVSGLWPSQLHALPVNSMNVKEFEAMTDRDATGARR